MNHNNLHQIIHTLGGEIFHLPDHLKLLFEAYYELYGGYVKLSEAEISKEISTLLARSHCPKECSQFVKITVSPAAKVTIELFERSLYKGYTLRCVTPRAAVIEFTMPHLELPTSLRDNVTQFANEQAQKRSAQVALRVHGGLVDLICGAQIFGVKDNSVITHPTSHSVEHPLAIKAALSLGYSVELREILSSELGSFDELFFVDHTGVTSIKSCDGHHYMSITAAAVAAELGRV